MPLNKDVAAWLARQVPAESLSLAALRHQTDLSLITQQGEARNGHYQHSFTFPASDGHAITVRVYVPCTLEQQTGRPALIWAHGGGWCLGSLTAWDRPCRLLAENTGCVVFSVDYRLAPEHRWPVPLNDLWRRCAGSATMPQTGIWTARGLPWEVTVPGGIWRQRYA